MAWFDAGAGLAEAGKSVAAFAGAVGLEHQKAELEKERIVLADQLAGARQDKQNLFTTSERLSTQDFTAAENKANRENVLEGHRISAGATIAGHQISAAASMKAAELSAASHKAGIQMQIDAMKDVRDVEIQKGKLDNILKQGLSDARTELTEAMKGGDQKAINAAKSKVAALEYSSQDDVKNATLLLNSAKMKEQDWGRAEAEVTKLQADLTKLNNNQATAMLPEGKAAIAKMEAQIAMQQRRAQQLKVEYDTVARQYEAAVKDLPTFSTGLNANVLKYDAEGNRIGAPTAPAPAAGPPAGLIGGNPAGGPR